MAIPSHQKAEPPLAWVLAGILAVLFVMPHHLVVPYLIYAALGCLLSFSVTTSATLSRYDSSSVSQGLKVLWPLMVLFPVVMLSHLHGSSIGIAFSKNDLSEYVKYALPMIVFIGATGSSTRLSLKLYDKIAVCVAWLYVAVFVAYYALGGPGGVFDSMQKSGRYGGLEYNPNSYTAIANILLLYIIGSYMVTKEVARLIPMIGIIVSVLFAQSRTGMIYVALSVVMLLLLSRGRWTTKGMALLVVSTIAVLGINVIDLFYFNAETAYDLASNRSWDVRVANSIRAVDIYGASIGLIGVGPAKARFDDLDMVAYVIYYVRYGSLGLALIVLFNVNAIVYFSRELLRLRKRELVSSLREVVLLINVILPIATLIATVSNDKWMDVKYMVWWSAAIAVGVAIVVEARCETRATEIERLSAYGR